MGALVQLVRQRRVKYSEDWLVLVTTDHGGTPDRCHGRNELLHRRTFVIANGNRTVSNHVVPPTLWHRHAARGRQQPPWHTTAPVDLEELEEGPGMVCVGVTALHHLLQNTPRSSRGHSMDNPDNRPDVSRRSRTPMSPRQFAKLCKVWGLDGVPIPLVVS